MGWYLMIKTAVELDLKYLCKCGDYKDHVKYTGSGVLWRRMLKKHQPTLITEVLGYFETKEHLRMAGEYYSRLFNVVEDKQWANFIPEIGDGGPTIKGRVKCYNPQTKEIRCVLTMADIPDGWIHGMPRFSKSPESRERTRQFHEGRKRSDQTRERMRNSVRRKRVTIPCTQCGNQYTKQNIVRHQSKCKG